MDNQQSNMTDYSEQKRGEKKIVQTIGKIVLPIIVLAVGGLVSFYLFSSSPKARKLPKKKNVPAVQTVKGTAGNHTTTISAMGTVKPARQISLSPQVSGAVVSLSADMLPGGLFSRGDTLLQIDTRDYQLMLRQQENAVVQAENNLEIEQGRQIVAVRELELSGAQVSDADKRLMLREPQLQSLENTLDIAQAKLEQAQLDIEHARLTAPFNGIVQSLDVNLGSWLAKGAKVATFVGTDSFWVEALIPEDQLRWIHIPQQQGETGAAVKIYNPSSWGSEQYREGRVLQLLPTLENRGRMARLLVEIEDPLSLQTGNKQQPKLLVGSFVRLLIAGKTVENAMQIPRKYLHDGNTLWIYKPDDTLGLRQVDILFENKDSVLIEAALGEQEEIIISSLAAPVEGMKLVRKSDRHETGNTSRTAVGHKDAGAADRVKSRGDN